MPPRPALVAKVDSWLGPETVSGFAYYVMRPLMSRYRITSRYLIRVDPGSRPRHHEGRGTARIQWRRATPEIFCALARGPQTQSPDGGTAGLPLFAFSTSSQRRRNSRPWSPRSSGIGFREDHGNARRSDRPSSRFRGALLCDGIRFTETRGYQGVLWGNFRGNFMRSVLGSLFKTTAWAISSGEGSLQIPVSSSLQGKPRPA